MRRFAVVWLTLGALVSVAAGCADGEGEALGERSDPIVGGTPTSGDTAVVAILLQDQSGNGGGLCSGSLISPRVVLTAAHCVDGIPRHEVYFGAKSDGADIAFLGQVPVVRAVHHPRWVGLSGLTEGFDVGLLLMAGPAPEGVTPLPVRTAPLDPVSDLGRAVRMVGFGNSAADFGAGRKREATSAIGDVTDRLVVYGDEVINTCQGDSGGPIFVDEAGVEQVAGIVSFGAQGCMVYGAGVRVDVFAESFIQPWVAAMDRPGCLADGACEAGCVPHDVDCEPRGTGEPCVAATECASVLCLPAPDDAEVSYCSAVCGGDGECPAPMICAPAGEVSVCAYPAPTPGAVGAACEQDLDCAGLACLEVEGVRACRRFCKSDARCGDSATCEPLLTGEGSICVPKPPHPPDCTCRAAPGAGPPFPVWLLFALIGGRFVVVKLRRASRRNC